MYNNLKISIESLFAQIDIIKALVLRETRTTFGKDNLGYIWAFVGPMAWIGTFAIMFMVGKRHPPNDMDIIGFLATGLLPYIMFRTVVSKTMNAIKANKPLLYYPQIRPLDLVIARTMLETATTTMIFIILLISNTIYLEHLPLDNLLNIMTGLLLTSLLAATLGLTLSSITTKFKSVDHLISPILRPLLWISGTFFSASQLDPKIRGLFLWNPLLHIIELTRSGWFKSYNSPFINLQYVITWILVLGVAGLLMERVSRRKLEV